MLNCSGKTLGALVKFCEGVKEARVSVGFSSAVPQGRNVYRKHLASLTLPLDQSFLKFVGRYLISDQKRVS